MNKNFSLRLLACGRLWEIGDRKMFKVQKLGYRRWAIGYSETQVQRYQLKARLSCEQGCRELPEGFAALE